MLVVKYFWSPLSAHAPGTMASALRSPWLPHDPGTKVCIVTAGAAWTRSDWLLPISLLALMMTNAFELLHNSVP